jgi:hemolysin activation/secretion protein
MMSSTRTVVSVLGAVCLFGSLTLYTPVSHAATPTPQQLDQIQREQNQIIQDEQQRQKELLKEQDQRRRPPGTVDLGIGKEGPLKGKSEQCFTIKTIELDGARSLSPKERHKLVQPFVGKCIGLVEIRELMRVITNYYIDKGYVTTRVYIPQQDMSTGTLKLLVVEGITEKFRLQDKKSRVNLGTAFPGLEGKVLNIRDIEQGLDQINRLQSNNATMQLLPGQTPGKSLILIKNQARKPWSGGVTLDNYGSRTTGKARGTVNLGWDNPLGLNDYWFMSLSSNTNPDRYDRLSESALLNFNIPYGYWNFTGSYSQSDYANLIDSLTQTFRSNGKLYTTNLGVQRVISRGQTYKTTLSAGLTHKDSRNYIEGSLLTTSSRKLTALNVDLITVFSALGGSWTVDGGVTHGVDWFGVQELPGAGQGTVPTAKYWKYNASASYARPFKLRGLNASWSSSLQGQYSRDYLFGSEQIAVGGLYTVRGYDGTSVSGDRGIYWRNDVAVTLSHLRTPGLAKWVGALQPYVALDAGHIYKRPGQQSGTMVGAAVGLRNVGGKVSFDFACGVPVHYSSGVSTTSDVKNYAVYLKMSISI